MAEQARRCFVCARRILTAPVYIGQDLYRHAGCEPGSRRYMRNRRLARIYRTIMGTRKRPTRQPST